MMIAQLIGSVLYPPQTHSRWVDRHRCGDGSEATTGQASDARFARSGRPTGDVTLVRSRRPALLSREGGVPVEVRETLGMDEQQLHAGTRFAPSAQPELWASSSAGGRHMTGGAGSAARTLGVDLGAAAANGTVGRCAFCGDLLPVGPPQLGPARKSRERLAGRCGDFALCARAGRVTSRVACRRSASGSRLDFPGGDRREHRRVPDAA